MKQNNEVQGMKERNISNFSVLMSVYFKENPVFFDEALKSNLVEQTRIPDEMILVCDGVLTEQLDEVIEKYRKQFPAILKVYRLKKNKGLGNALNFGLKKCSYEWIARSDSDDICSKNRFEVQIDYLNKHPDIYIVGSYIDEFVKDYTMPIYKKTVPLVHEKIYEYAKFRNPINHMTVVFNKKRVIEVGSYQHLPYVEDYYLWIRAICNGVRVANIDQYLVHARIGNGMIERRGNREYIRSWKVLNEYMKRVNMINWCMFCKNMFAVKLFVNTPSGIKSHIYKLFLRNY